MKKNKIFTRKLALIIFWTGILGIIFCTWSRNYKLLVTFAIITAVLILITLCFGSIENLFLSIKDFFKKKMVKKDDDEEEEEKPEIKADSSGKTPKVKTLTAAEAEEKSLMAYASAKANITALGDTYKSLSSSSEGKILIELYASKLSFYNNPEKRDDIQQKIDMLCAEMPELEPLNDVQKLYYEAAGYQYIAEELKKREAQPVKTPAPSTSDDFDEKVKRIAALKKEREELVNEMLDQIVHGK